MANPKLSILTPAVFSRLDSVDYLQRRIASQHDGSGSVEHLVLFDNKARSIGAKRQALLEIAKGDYIAFVDDDDDVSGDYVQSLLGATTSKAGVITFRQHATFNGQQSDVHFSMLHHDEQFNPGGITKRCAWHVCAWRRELVRNCVFEFSNYGEDLAWALQARRCVANEAHIKKVLHYYRHDAEKTEAPAP